MTTPKLKSAPQISAASRFEDIDLVILGDTNADELIEELSGQNYVFDLGGGDDSAAVKSISDSSELYLNADSGNDTILLSGRFGQSTITGGEGQDKISFTSATDGLMIIAGEDGNDRITATGSILGGGGDDVLKATSNDLSPEALFWGEQGDDILRGGLGNDYLDGGSNNDIISGKDGSDELFGGQGNDKLNGGVGDDYLNGGSGKDTLIGGKGSDIFDAGDKDVIKDFSPGQGDMIYIEEERYGSKISAADTKKGARLTSEDGLKLLIEDTSTFVAQAYLSFY